LSLQDNIVLFADFDSDANDDSGNGRNGTNTGCTFDGTSMTVGDTHSVDFGTGTPATTLNGASWSISVWVNPSSLGADFGIVSKDQNSPFPFSLRMNFPDTTNLDVLWNGADVPSATHFSTSTLYHVVLTYDGTNLRIYVNGSLDTTSAQGTHLNNNGDSLIVGTDYQPLNSRHWHGTIRCFGLWSITLSSGDVTALYDSGTPLKWTDMAPPAANSGLFALVA
jgi:hypothetical protein